MERSKFLSLVEWKQFGYVHSQQLDWVGTGFSQLQVEVLREQEGGRFLHMFQGARRDGMGWPRPDEPIRVQKCVAHKF